MSKRRRLPIPPPTDRPYKSDPIDDRSSTFIASYHPHRSAKDLQDDPAFTNAMHRMAAWRIISIQRSLSAKPVLEVGHDDDGEKWKADNNNNRPAKQLKTDLDKMDKEALMAILKGRDQTIDVLRKMLAERKGVASASQGEASSPCKKMDYGNLPVAALQKLVNVRDSTIGWILKEIEKMEEAKMERDSEMKTKAEASTIIVQVVAEATDSAEKE
ncbi:MAG: hypothetical protein Q9181_003436 [Wetmoreana brouardii]